MDPNLYFTVLVPLALALLAINYELIKDSEYRKEKVRKQERKALLEIMDKVKGISANPDVRDYYNKVKALMEERSKY